MGKHEQPSPTEVMHQLEKQVPETRLALNGLATQNRKQTESAITSYCALLKSRKDNSLINNFVSFLKLCELCLSTPNNKNDCKNSNSKGLSGRIIPELEQSDIIPDINLKKEEVNESFEKKNIFYVGDSYGVGTFGIGKRDKLIKSINVSSQNSRPLCAPKNNFWNKNDVVSRALMFLKNDDCEAIVLMGGLNDLYTFDYNPEKTYNRIIKGYEKIFSLAKERGIKVIVYNVPKISKRHDKKKEINKYTDKINKWLSANTDIDVIDTGSAVGENWSKDLIHPNEKGYKGLYKKLNSYISS